jgi:hypothetical protein
METINIVEPDNSFNFTNLSLGILSTLAGGSYFSRIYSANKPLYIQTPRCLTKQGFIKSGKKQYCDLMFTNQDELFVNWIENLETTCQKLLYEKNEADSWFSSKLELSDIESSFTSPLKVFKSGKYYLIRVNAKQNLKIFDEHNKEVSIDSIKNDMNMLCVIEVQGIKFTSKSFQIEFELKQSLIVSPDPFLDNCLIKSPLVKTQDKEDNTHDKQDTNEKPGHSGYKDNDEQNNYIDDEITEAAILEMADNMINKSKHNEIIKQKEITNISLNDLESNDLDIETKTKLNTEINSKMEINPLENNSKKEAITFSNDSISNIELDIIEIADNQNELTEVNLKTDNSLETITLKKPNQVYYEIYREARKKAKESKKIAILAYLEAKNIKKTYMLDDSDDSEESDNDSDFDNLSISDFDENELNE